MHGSRLLLPQLNVLLLDMDENLGKSRNWAAKAPTTFSYAQFWCTAQLPSANYEHMCAKA